ncbi:MFS transporter [Limnohabitans sp. Rim28]|uniref:MFS transporter n=1 Tax=Limnohabitans sp. Rim28 TaxID=1100720 RepID=UPI0002F8CF6C|nr:MFS transporter [Limnohabitans sp. Rim28]PVE05808.1 MFS transporter [Limnohabitans sp. Rim28]
MMQSWWPLLLTLVIQAMVAMALLTLPVIAPVVALDLQVSPALVGLYVSVTYAGAMVATLMGGATVARMGAIRVSQWGLVLCAVGLVLCAVPWLPAMVLGAVFIGLGYGPITPASSHLLARTTPKAQMSLVFSIKQTGVPLGSMLAGAIVPPLALLIDWQLSMWVVAALCLACAGVSQSLRAELDSDRQADLRIRWGSLIEPIRMVLAHRALLTMASCSFMFSMVQLSLTTYLVTFLHDDLSYGLVAAGLALSVTQLGGIGGRVAWGYVADRWLGARRMLLLLASMMALCALGSAFLVTDTPHAVVIALLVGFGASAIGWNGVYLAEVARRAPPGMASMATGGTLAFTFLGVVLGPPMFGALSGLFGTYRAGFVGLMVMASVSGTVLYWSQRPR